MRQASLWPIALVAFGFGPIGNAIDEKEVSPRPGEEASVVGEAPVWEELGQVPPESARATLAAFTWTAGEVTKPASFLGATLHSESGVLRVVGVSAEGLPASAPIPSLLLLGEDGLYRMYHGARARYGLGGRNLGTLVSARLVVRPDGHLVALQANVLKADGSSLTFGKPVSDASSAAFENGCAYKLVVRPDGSTELRCGPMEISTCLLPNICRVIQHEPGEPFICDCVPF